MIDLNKVQKDLNLTNADIERIQKPWWDGMSLIIKDEELVVVENMEQLRYMNDTMMWKLLIDYPKMNIDKYIDIEKFILEDERLFKDLKYKYSLQNIFNNSELFDPENMITPQMVVHQMKTNGRGFYVRVLETIRKNKQINEKFMNEMIESFIKQNNLKPTDLIETRFKPLNIESDSGYIYFEWK